MADVHAMLRGRISIGYFAFACVPRSGVSIGSRLVFTRISRKFGQGDRRSWRNAHIRVHVEASILVIRDESQSASHHRIPVGAAVRWLFGAGSKHISLPLENERSRSEGRLKP